MLKADQVRMQHMLDSAREALLFVQNKSRSSLDSDRKLTLALVKSIEIIGEAASNVSIECHGDYSNVPWKSIISMRNRLIHAYFDIDLDILWSTVTEDLPPLIEELEKIVETSEF
ncbi:MAG: DUF86 domain-containing protein [Candidatus Hydrothermarchaeales archaeon]